MQEANHPVAPDHQQLRQTWKAHIERWKDSGQTQTAFCLQYGLKPHQFTYWKKRFIQANTGISFVPQRRRKSVPVRGKLKPHRSRHLRKTRLYPG